LGNCLKWFLLNYLPCKMSGGLHILDEDVFPIGSRVYVTNDRPFRGRIGTILAIHMIATPCEPTFCFYLVALDGTQLQGPLWFEYHEVELVGLSCEQIAE
jgi:hypothetical protein